MLRFGRHYARINRVISTRSMTTLTEPLSGVPEHSKQATDASGEPMMSNLDNGVRVVSLGRQHPLVSVGLLAEAGSRFETHATAGAAFFLSQIFTKATQTQSSLRITRELETLAPNVRAEATRDTVGVFGSVPRDDAGALVQTFADVFQPALREWEVKDSRSYVERQAVAALTGPGQVMDLLHAEAFRNASLGRPLVLAHGAGSVSLAGLQQHVEQCYTAPRMMLVAAGLEHDEAVRIAQLSLKGFKSGSESAAAGAYVGGNARVEMPGDVTNFAVAHSCAGVSPAAARVLAALIGRDEGIDAYHRIGSARRLGQNNGVFLTAEGFLTSSNLLGVVGSAAAGSTGEAVTAARSVLAGLAQVTDAELEGAKQAAIRVVHDEFATSTRAVPLLAQQALSGSVASASEIASAIGQLSSADVTSAAQTVLGTTESLAAVGDVEGL